MVLRGLPLSQAHNSSLTLIEIFIIRHKHDHHHSGLGEEAGGEKGGGPDHIKSW